MKLRLVVLSEGKTAGKVIHISPSPFVIGRGPHCHLRPVSPQISKRHCALFVKDGEAYVRDFGSTNGSFINGEKVIVEQELRHGDVLTVGPLRFRVHVEQTSAIDSPTPLPPFREEPARTAPLTKETLEDTGTAAAAILEKYYRRKRG